MPEQKILAPDKVNQMHCVFMEDQLSGKSTGLGVFVLSKTTKVVIGSNPIDSTNKPGANRLSDGSTPSSSTRR